MSKDKRYLTNQTEKQKRRVTQYISRTLLMSLIHSVPNFAAIFFLKLYDLSKGNRGNIKSITAYKADLYERLNISESSFKRAMRELKKAGYIKVRKLESQINGQTPNVINIISHKELRAVQGKIR